MKNLKTALNNIYVATGPRVKKLIRSMNLRGDYAQQRRIKLVGRDKKTGRFISLTGQSAWMTALRSGKFPQIRGALKTEDGFCCLGVLQEISDYDEDSAYTVTGMSVVNVSAFIDMNDKERLTFTEIADRVEANPHRYFTT
jgi:hypothetical protein